jgi:hypothetical protein
MVWIDRIGPQLLDHHRVVRPEYSADELRGVGIEGIGTSSAAAPPTPTRRATRPAPADGCVSAPATTPRSPLIQSSVTLRLCDLSQGGVCYDLLRGAVVVADGLEPTGLRPRLAGYDLVLLRSLYDCLADH